MVVIRNRKTFLITIFILFTVLYWVLLFPVMWMTFAYKMSRAWWWAFVISAATIYLILAIVSIHLVRKYNYWTHYPTNYHQEKRDAYGFQCQYGQKSVCTDHNVELSLINNGISNKSNNGTICDDFVDKKILQDAETQTDNGSISPGIYRTSLVMDVQPRSPSGSSTSSMWYYPTMAEYYNHKTNRLKDRLSRAQQEQAQLERQEQQLVQSVPVAYLAEGQLGGISTDV